MPRLRKISDAVDENQVIDLIEDGTLSLAYDLLNLKIPYKHQVERTVEFRQHKDTLGAEKIVH